MGKYIRAQLTPCMHVHDCACMLACAINNVPIHACVSNIISCNMLYHLPY
jgi:hypothetical protein